MIEKIVFLVTDFDKTETKSVDRTTTYATTEINVTKGDEDANLRLGIRDPNFYWIAGEKKVQIRKKVIQCYPSFNWDTIACVFFNIEIEKHEIAIYNEDGTLSIKVTLPQSFIGTESFKKHFPTLKKEYLADNINHPVKFFFFSGYFEYEDKHFLDVIIEKKINDGTESLLESRYLDMQTGTFLPFTKYICHSYPNQWDMTDDFRIL